MKLQTAAKSLHAHLLTTLGREFVSVGIAEKSVIAYVASHTSMAKVPREWYGFIVEPKLMRLVRPQRDDEVTQVSAIYADAEKKLARTTDAGERVVDAALALERAVAEAPTEAKEKISSAVPETMQAAKCRRCGKLQYDHFLVTDHVFVARDEDR